MPRAVTASKYEMTITKSMGWMRIFFAEAVHRRSCRRTKPIAPRNSRALAHGLASPQFCESLDESELTNRLSFLHALHPGLRRWRYEDGVRADELGRPGPGANVCRGVEPVANRSRKRCARGRAKRATGAGSFGTPTQRDHRGWRWPGRHRQAGHERADAQRIAKMLPRRGGNHPDRL